jgi:hypothetical protein
VPSGETRRRCPIAERNRLLAPLDVTAADLAIETFLPMDVRSGSPSSARPALLEHRRLPRFCQLGERFDALGDVPGVVFDPAQER